MSQSQLSSPPAQGAPHPEAEAVEAALHGTPFDRLRVAGRAALRLAQNPQDTQQVFLIGIVANRRRLPGFLAKFASEEGGAELLVNKPSIDSQHLDYQALRELPDGTLGREYVRYLDDNGLDPDIFQETPGLPDIAGFISKRMRQSHDLWHVVTGYDTNVSGEIALQAFTFAQTQMPSSLAVAAIGMLRQGLREPSVFKLAKSGYLRGRKAKFLPTVHWESMWEMPLDEVRAKLGVAPMN